MKGIVDIMKNKKRFLADGVEHYKETEKGRGIGVRATFQKAGRMDHGSHSN